MKNKTRKNKKENKSSHHDNRGDIKIEKLIIKDDAGCITVNNSFEDNFKNYLKNETTAESRLKKKSVSIGKELIRAFDKPLAPPIPHFAILLIVIHTIKKKKLFFINYLNTLYC